MRTLQFGLIASGFEKYGSQEALQQNAIQHLLEIYVKVNADAENDPKVREDAAAWFKRMEDGDEEALRNWREWRELSIRKYEEEYARLNVRFDEYTGESRVSPKVMAAALERLQEMGLIEEDNGALRVNLEKYKLGKAVVRKRGAFVSGSFFVSVFCLVFVGLTVCFGFVSADLSFGIALSVETLFAPFGGGTSWRTVAFGSFI